MNERETVGEGATDKKILLPKSDLIFKMLFGDERNSDILMDFLKSVLRLHADEYASLEIVDPNLQREYEDDKLGILDVKLKTKSGKVVDVEVQVAEMPHLRERAIFYNSKMVAEQIGRGDDYYKIKQSISIIITDFGLIDASPKYHHRFTLYDSENGVEFTDLIEVHTLELSKLPTETDGTPLYDWAKFIGAEGVEEMRAVAERNPVVGQAMARVMEMSADEKTRYQYEARQKALMDYATRMRGALEQGLAQGREEGRTEGRAEGRAEGKAEGRAEGEYNRAVIIAKKLITANVPIDTIIATTDLTRAEIEGLKN